MSECMQREIYMSLYAKHVIDVYLPYELYIIHKVL